MISMPPTYDRDLTMGQYIDAWSSLEDLLFVLFWKLVTPNHDIARAIYSTGIQPKNLEELLITIAPYRMTKSEQKKLAPLCERFRNASLRRNKIIHSVWEIETKAGKSQWVRIYSPISNEKWGELRKVEPKNPQNQKIRSSYRFTIPQLLEEVKQIEILYGEFHNLISNFIDRLPPYEE